MNVLNVSRKILLETLPIKRLYNKQIDLIIIKQNRMQTIQTIGVGCML